jgi:amino acid permease|tara:strand:+ start:834 stop:1271 length:438 start_codon:yes stop_codon:yes gene_type:complete
MQKIKVNSEKYSLKHVIVLAFLFMMIGTLLELYLLNHYENILQLIPVLCIAIALINSIFIYFRRSKASNNIFKIVLFLTSISGISGVFFHLQANYEFEQEIKPTANSLELFLESISGAFPVLAPLSMVVLALIGYSYLILINQKQ